MHRVPEIKTSVAEFLKEDVGSGDLTAAIINPATWAQATVVTREPMVLCGQSWFEEVFQQLNEAIEITWQIPEGSNALANSVLCKLAGQARPLLTGERTALNILQTLSATATVARQYARAVAGTTCRVLDTRKTLPGLRMAQKYAVALGGCYNHRAGLYDAILIKENHILAAGSIANAIAQARQISNAMVEVEVENLQEFQQAIAAQADRVMLDNFSVADLQTAVHMNHHNIALEASGNVTLSTIRTIAETGVDYVSIGALTKHIKAIDLSMRITLEDYL